MIDVNRTTPYTLTVIAGDGQLMSHDATITINPAEIVQGQPQLVSTALLAKLPDGSYQAVIAVSNHGNGTAQNVRVVSGALGAAGTVTPIPVVLVNIPAGGYATSTINFPKTAGVSGAPVVESYLGTYNGGTFGGSIRAVLP